MSSDDSFLDFKCPHCGELVSYPHDAIGRVQECFNCLENFIVPQPGAALGRMIPVPITTPRLILRRFADTDWKRFLELVQDEAFYHRVDDLRANDEAHVLAWLENDRTLKLTTPGQPYRLAITRAADGLLNGYVVLRLDGDVQSQLSLVLPPDPGAREDGLEAIRAVLRLCLGDLNLHRVVSACDASDDAGCQLLEKAGLRREAEFVKDRRSATGGWASTRYYAMLGEEFAR